MEENVEELEERVIYKHLEEFFLHFLLGTLPPCGHLHVTRKYGGKMPMRNVSYPLEYLKRGYKQQQPAWINCIQAVDWMPHYDILCIYVFI